MSCEPRRQYLAAKQIKLDFDGRHQRVLVTLVMSLAEMNPLIALSFPLKQPVTVFSSLTRVFRRPMRAILTLLGAPETESRSQILTISLAPQPPIRNR